MRKNKVTLIHPHIYEHSAEEMESITGLTMKEIRKLAKSWTDYLGIKESTMSSYLSKWSAHGNMSMALEEFFALEFELPGKERAIELHDKREAAFHKLLSDLAQIMVDMRNDN